MTLAVLHLTVSCSYYKVKPVNTKPETMANHIRSFNEQNKYVIIHSSNNLQMATCIELCKHANRSVK